MSPFKLHLPLFFFHLLFFFHIVLLDSRLQSISHQPPCITLPYTSPFKLSSSSSTYSISLFHYLIFVYFIRLTFIAFHITHLVPLSHIRHPLNSPSSLHLLLTPSLSSTSFFFAYLIRLTFTAFHITNIVSLSHMSSFKLPIFSSTYSISLSHYFFCIFDQIHLQYISHYPSPIHITL